MTRGSKRRVPPPAKSERRGKSKDVTPVPQPTPPASGLDARRGALLAGLVACLALLLAHVLVYRFLTDDAYISFRYARNLADGHGLIFNPGAERVEGYSNFLWVLLLAVLDLVGLAPERTAIPLSLAATVILWTVVVATAWRGHARDGRAWIALVPALALALNRSFAVWATSGLETRFFEALFVIGALRCCREVGELSAGRPTRVLSPWLFALATLTRPDGLLLSLSVFAAGAVCLRFAKHPIGGFLRGAWPFAALVGGHYLFRRLYYGEWLPNTYHAKVGGQMWWDSGIRYFAAFVLEYGALLWIPLLVLAWLHHRRRGTLHVAALFAAAVVPHALYIAAIGGDHFEYRPLDLYLPFLFLLLADGVHEWLARRLPRPALAAWAIVAAFGLTSIPWQTHRQFPQRYHSGFPGGSKEDAGLYLAPDRDPLLRWPGLRSIAVAYRELLVGLTRQFVGIRQEEHRLFLQTAREQGERIRDAIEQGRLPRDVRIAMDCVGVIPYLSGAWTLDRLGLTDAHVARSPFIKRVMAHGKYATMEYARERGVDLWPVDYVHTILPVTSVPLMAKIEELAWNRSAPEDSTVEAYSAILGGGNLLVCLLPQGPAAAARRMPALRFQSLRDTAFRREFFARLTAACAESLRRDPDNYGMNYRFGYSLVASGRFEEAWSFHRRRLERMPLDLRTVDRLYASARGMGDRRRMVEALEIGIAIAQRTGNASIESAWRAQLARDSAPAEERSAAPPGQ